MNLTFLNFSDFDHRCKTTIFCRTSFDGCFCHFSRKNCSKKWKWKDIKQINQFIYFFVNLPIKFLSKNSLLIIIIFWKATFIVTSPSRQKTDSVILKNKHQARALLRKKLFMILCSAVQKLYKLSILWVYIANYLSISRVLLRKKLFMILCSAVQKLYKLPVLWVYIANYLSIYLFIYLFLLSM